MINVGGVIGGFVKALISRCSGFAFAASILILVAFAFGQNRAALALKPEHHSSISLLIFLCQRGSYFHSLSNNFFRVHKR
jgi:hypothetical protein